MWGFAGDGLRPCLRRDLRALQRACLRRRRVCPAVHCGLSGSWSSSSRLMLRSARPRSASPWSPFYPYPSDKKHQGREPISARLMPADLYRTAEKDRIMSVDLHASQEQGFF